MWPRIPIWIFCSSWVLPFVLIIASPEIRKYGTALNLAGLRSDFRISWKRLRPQQVSTRSPLVNPYRGGSLTAIKKRHVQAHIMQRGKERGGGEGGLAGGSEGGWGGWSGMEWSEGICTALLPLLAQHMGVIQRRRAYVRTCVRAYQRTCWPYVNVKY